jgi:hypothetical protein
LHERRTCVNELIILLIHLSNVTDSDNFDSDGNCSNSIVQCLNLIFIESGKNPHKQGTPSVSSIYIVISCSGRAPCFYDEFVTCLFVSDNTQIPIVVIADEDECFEK